MQKVLFPRYQAQRSTIITSNIPWEAWGDYLDDQLGATAILDRLIHHSHVIIIDGPSYRDRAHRQDVADRQAKKAKTRAKT
jgi:DNA replication protein DnaC